MKKRVVILSGAGMSAESGISTFRDAGGLWEGHNVMEVASPEGFRKNPELVLEFYNLRRRQLLEVHPNKGHKIVAALETDFDVHVITQNVDDLHERAGSSRVLHLHGELLKARCTRHDNEVIDWRSDILVGTKHPQTSMQLRPHIVWFGEAVPAIAEAASITATADILVIIGTSLQVYPAAGLIDCAPANVPVYYIDPHPAQLPCVPNPIEVLPMTASEGMALLREKLFSGN